MRIFHYIPSIDCIAGGTSTYMQILAKLLGEIAEVHRRLHISDNPLPIESCQAHYVPVYNPLTPKFEIKVNAALLNKICPDLVHVNCCWLLSCAECQRIAQKYGYKVVLTPHGMLEPWIIHCHYLTRKLPVLMIYQKVAIRKADCLQATADTERENLLKLDYNSNIKVVKLGIDTDCIALKTLWKRNKQILFLSRVHVKKEVNFLIGAAARLRDELQGYKIIVEGEGDADYLTTLKRQIADSGLQDIVQLIDGVYGRKKRKLFQTSDFFVLPTHFKNFGLAIAEALAS